MLPHLNQVYLINLKRRPEKLIKVLWSNDHFFFSQPLKIIEAIDGHQLSPKPSELSPGAYGYVLTWERIIQEAIRKKHQRILILDDDIICIRDFHTRFKKWYQELLTQRKRKQKWKIILLGASQHGFGSVKFQDPNYYHPHHTDGSFAVLLDRSIFSELLSLLRTHQKLVDSHCLRELYRKYPKTCYVAYPNLMIADLSISDIRVARSQDEMARKFRWGDLRQYHYPLQKPLVSIIIPCYRAERTIKRCLESMIAQTYRPLEIIVVDDGSPDGSFDRICQVFRDWPYDPRMIDLTFQLYKHGKNQGCYSARNTGIRLAQGDLIAFQDADDISFDTRIEKQVRALLMEQVEVVCCQFLRTHLKTLSYDPAQLKKDLAWSTAQHPGKYCCRAKIALATTLFRKTFLTRLGGSFLEKCRWGGDAEFLMRYFTPPAQQTVMAYLDSLDKIPGQYYQVKEVLYVSHEMTEQNLTSQRLRANQ